MTPDNFWGGPHGVVVNVLDCDIVVSEFELLSHYYIHFRTNNNTIGKGMNLLIRIPSYALNRTTAVLISNNPRRLICHETKSNYIYIYIVNVNKSILLKQKINRKIMCDPPQKENMQIEIICIFIFLFFSVVGPKREKSKHFKMNKFTWRFVFF